MSSEDKVKRAVEFLHANGKHAGKDFDLRNAVSKADELAYEIEVAKASAWLRENKELTAFDGDSSCEDCGGWDGESRRCVCGNRRVSWVSNGDFENPSIYAEAW